jgi:hypothetical protein
MDGYIEDANGVVVSTNYENPNGAYWFTANGPRMMLESTLVDVINVWGVTFYRCHAGMVNWDNIAYWKFSTVNPTFIENE